MRNIEPKPVSARAFRRNRKKGALAGSLIFIRPGMLVDLDAHGVHVDLLLLQLGMLLLV